MSYSPMYLSRNFNLELNRLWKENFFKTQYLEKDRWIEVYDALDQHVPANSSILDIGAGDEHAKSHFSVDRYVSWDFNGKCDINQDLNYQSNMDLTAYGHFDIGLCVEVLEYIINPIEVFTNLKSRADKWIFTTRVNRPDHIYVANHPLKYRYRHWKEVANTLKQVFNNVTVTPIETNLTTCSGRMKPFALAICED